MIFITQESILSPYVGNLWNEFMRRLSCNYLWWGSDSYLSIHFSGFAPELSIIYDRLNFIPFPLRRS